MPNRVQYGATWSVAANGGKACPAPLQLPVATAYQAAINGGGNVDLNIGDIVRIVNGFIELADGSEGAGGGESIYGVIVAVRPFFDTTIGQVGALKPTNRLPGGTVYGTNLDRQSLVQVVPMDAGIWEMDCDDNVTATTLAAYQALVNENVDFINTEDAALAKAQPRLDISGHGTPTAQLRITNVSPTLNNQDFSDTFVKLWVRVNESQETAYTTVGS